MFYHLPDVQAATGEQRLTPVVVSQAVQAGENVVLTIRYATGNPSDGHTSGLGVGVHYDSSKLVFTGFSDVYQDLQTLSGTNPAALIGRDSVPREDEADRDRDSTTNRMVGLAWVGLDGRWPDQGVTLPMDLFKVHFRVSAGAQGATTVRLSSLGTANGFVMTATPADVQATPSAYVVLDVDHSGIVDATDGLLIQRRMNGADIIDSDVRLPTGQNNRSVVERVDELCAYLDVDRSGQVDATDGLLVVRRLNGADILDSGLLLPVSQSNATVISNVDALK
ncbi:MAG: hypothetical protein HQL97_09825 [Magnetococcales bacterium]|nr:hypothetical protein [Magnetococcales bacterium]